MSVRRRGFLIQAGDYYEHVAAPCIATVRLDGDWQVMSQHKTTKCCADEVDDERDRLCSTCHKRDDDDVDKAEHVNTYWGPRPIHLIAKPYHFFIFE